jgi:hypothetical protein
LNTPLENYVQMEAIFGGSLATGKYVMGSNEPLGTDMGPVDAIAAEDKSDLASPEVQSGKGKESLGVMVAVLRCNGRHASRRRLGGTPISPPPI